MDYTTLIADKNTDGSIKSWISYGKVPSTVILEEAQTELYRRLRTREMRVTVDVPLALGANTAALPARYIDPIYMRLRNENYYLKHKPQHDLEGHMIWDSGLNNWATGLPSFFSVYNEIINFDRRADQTYTLRFSFYRQPELLGPTVQTNFLTERYPRLLRASCLRAAAEFMESTEKKREYEADVARILAEIDIMDEMSMTGLDPDLEISNV